MAAKKSANKKQVTKKRVINKRVTKKRVTKKRVTKKRVIKKRVTKKRVTKKRVIKKSVIRKPVSKKRTGRKVVNRKAVAKKLSTKKSKVRARNVKPRIVQSGKRRRVSKRTSNRNVLDKRSKKSGHAKVAKARADIKKRTVSARPRRIRLRSTVAAPRRHATVKVRKRPVIERKTRPINPKIPIRSVPKRMVTDFEKSNVRAFQILKELNRVSKILRGKGYEVSIIGPHINADSSIDVELRILAVEDYVQQFRDIVEYIPSKRGWWLIPIIMYDPSIEDAYDQSDFLVRGGMAGIPIHAAKAGPLAATKGLYARMLAQNIQEDTGLRIIEIVLRLHWNKEHKRPVYE